MEIALKKWFQLVVIIILVLVSLVLLFTALSVSNSKKLSEAVTAYPLLLNRCELWLFGKRPDKTLVLACPHIDLIRLYPLPLLHPWHEPEQALGGLEF